MPLSPCLTLDPAAQAKGIVRRTGSKDSCIIVSGLPGQVSDDRPQSAPRMGLAAPGPTQAWTVTAPARPLERKAAPPSVAQVGRRLGWEREDDSESEFQDRIQLLS